MWKTRLCIYMTMLSTLEVQKLFFPSSIDYHDLDDRHTVDTIDRTCVDYMVGWFPQLFNGVEIQWLDSNTNRIPAHSFFKYFLYPLELCYCPIGKRNPLQTTGIHTEK